MSCFKNGCQNQVSGSISEGVHKIEFCEEHRQEILALKGSDDLIQYKNEKD